MLKIVGEYIDNTVRKLFRHFGTQFFQNWEQRNSNKTVVWNAGTYHINISECQFDWIG